MSVHLTLNMLKKYENTENEKKFEMCLSMSVFILCSRA